MSLSPGHRARKAAQTLELVERAYRSGDRTAAPWVQELVIALASDPALIDQSAFTTSSGRGNGLKRLLSSFLSDSSPGSQGEEPGSGVGTARGIVSPLFLDPVTGIRSINSLRRCLEALSGGAPADWDFMEPLGTGLSLRARSVYPGMRAYLEDIRAPFNIGSMFRTGDAFGLSELLLSGFSADPDHPRARRSAMGATDLLPWRRVELADLEGLGEVFALELRGEPIDDFNFPEHGVAVLGSEELGVSPEALERCTRRVSIPMLGAKGSLNVGVAFGVLLAAWSRCLLDRGLAPRPVERLE